MTDRADKSRVELNRLLARLDKAQKTGSPDFESMYEYYLGLRRTIHRAETAKPLAQWRADIVRQIEQTSGPFAARQHAAKQSKKRK